jgi:hypothetical protein
VEDGLVIENAPSCVCIRVLRSGLACVVSLSAVLDVFFQMKTLFFHLRSLIIQCALPALDLEPHPLLLLLQAPKVFSLAGL